jgi:hypothetical protein
MSRLVVVAPLKPGSEARARELLDEGPPIDLESSRFDAHEVFVTPQEVIFVFEGSETLNFDAGDPGLLSAAKSWADCLDGRPRIARSAFFWKRDPGSG